MRFFDSEDVMGSALVSRRAVVLGAGAALLAAAVPAAADERTAVLPLWPAGAPGGGGPGGPVAVNELGAISHIATPTLEVFLPEQPNGAAMLVAGGGGYRRIEMATEAQPAARWLVERGIAAFVLSYRLPDEGWAAGPLAPLQDAQRALRLIRARAPAYRLDPARIGVLGFSAGGHLMGLTATRSAFPSYEPVDAADAQSAKPAAAALIYPVITLEPPFQHTTTRRILIGAHPAPQASAEWSVQTHVRAGCPPVFLVQAADDPLSDPQNTVIMAQACKQAGVPVELHRLPSGGHGFGMGKPVTPTADWPGWYDAWLRRVRLIV
jgi:acetyl esterase/lipase